MIEVHCQNTNFKDGLDINMTCVERIHKKSTAAQKLRDWRSVAEKQWGSQKNLEPSYSAKKLT